jgi:hypothetical protein
MNWNNIDLSSSEIELPILGPYTFSTLLLEIECNLPEITPETVRKQAENAIREKYRVALEVLESNLDNIVKYAQKERADV